MALKKPKLDRQTLLDRRYDYMRQAWELDGKTSVGFHYKTLLQNARDKYKVRPTLIAADGLAKLSTFDVCHLNHRTDTGEFDTLEWLITLSRQEHNWIDGVEPVVSRGVLGNESPYAIMAVEYKYLILHLLRKSTKDRWSKPRELLEKKISAERLKTIRKIEQ